MGMELKLAFPLSVRFGKAGVIVIHGRSTEDEDVDIQLDATDLINLVPRLTGAATIAFLHQWPDYGTEVYPYFLAAQDGKAYSAKDTKEPVLRVDTHAGILQIVFPAALAETCGKKLAELGKAAGVPPKARRN